MDRIRVIHNIILFLGCTKDPVYDEDKSDSGLLTRAQSEGKFYYAFDKKIYLDEIEDKIAVAFNEKYLSEINGLIKKNSGIHQDKIRVGENTSDDYFILKVTDESSRVMLIEDLSKQAGIKSINPIYIISDSPFGTAGEMVVTDEIIVQFKTGTSEQKINEMHSKFNVDIIKTTDRYQLLSVPVELDPLEVANAYQESGLTNFSYPNFISKAEAFQTLPTDPYFVNQYYLRNTGQVVNGRSCTAGADIDMTNAWKITKGSGDIVVAVLDEGVSSNHPDLPDTRQIRLNGSNFGDGNRNDPSPAGHSNHGNACAGIIAASHNSEGIAGIAPNCKIMPIRIFNSSGGGLHHALLADAITFAKNNGADVLSNSWGYTYQTDPDYYPLIVDAISDAVTNGRNGKGCVVVFAAGNTANHAGGRSGHVAFPSNVNVPGVLTVGASDRNDNQANYSPTSVLNSPYNQIVDIVAPSHRAYSSQISSETFDVWSIDTPGANGYNPVHYTDGGSLPTIGSYLPNAGTNYLAYTGHFGGTSAACPQVAGVAALLLSIRPNLTQMEVSEIIQSTARKAKKSKYIYQTTPGVYYGTWNAQMGHGVLDAYAVLHLVTACVNYFYNRTIISNETVNGCNTLRVTNVTVRNGASVVMTAGQTVSINSVFVAEAGARVTISN